MKISEGGINIVWFLTFLLGSACLGVGFKEVYFISTETVSVTGTAMMTLGAVAICCSAMLAVLFRIMVLLERRP